MHVYDADGNLSVTLGKQEDGTYSARPVAGPPPPAPVGLDAEGDAGLIHASWQGAFWAGAAMPRDFEAVEVLVDGKDRKSTRLHSSHVSTSSAVFCLK